MTANEWRTAMQEAAEEVGRKARWCLEMERRGKPQSAVECLLDVQGVLTFWAKRPDNPWISQEGVIHTEEDQA